MQVRLLGPVSAVADGVELALGGRKQRAVFALLALNANRVVSLDRLVYELWLDEPPERATPVLQSYVSRLRRLLHSDGDGLSRARIVSRPPGWMLEIPADRIDAVRFAELVDEAGREMQAGRPAAAGARLREGLALWSGDPLSDLDDAPFAVEEAARLQQLRLSAVELLFEADLATGNAPGVVEESRQFIIANPFRERAWCALILALYRSGRQADALDAVRLLRETLAEGLGLDPSPKARRLEEQILRQDPALEDGSRATSVAEHQTAPARGRIAPDAHAVDSVVGRAAVRAAMERAVAKSSRGEGSLLTLEGPAGMGKSTLLQLLAGTAEAAGGTVLCGAGVGATTMPALWPWVAIVRQLLAGQPNLAADAQRDGSLSPLALLDPNLAPGIRAPGTDGDLALARTRLYRAILDLLAAASRQHLTAILVDDAQWLDSETLNLLSLAVDELAPLGVLFAVTTRSDEPANTERLVAGVASNPRVPVLRLPLPGLEAAAVAELVRRTTDGEVDAAVADAITIRTAGNPLFTIELVQLLSSERRLDLDGVYTFLPAGVRDVLRRRLDRLPEQTLSLLTIAALVGRPVDVDLLAQVTGMDDDAVLEGCEAAVIAGLLHDDGDRGNGFTLSHDLVRQTLAESLSGTRRVRLHERIARALQAAEGRTPHPLPEQVVEIARHLTLAAPVVGPADALPYLMAAADDALSRLALPQAEQLLRTALELAAKLPHAARRQQVERQVRGQLTALQLYGLAVGAGDARSGPPRRSATLDPVLPIDPDSPAAWWSDAVLLIAIGENEQVIAAADTALQNDLPPPAAAAVHYVRGNACFSLGRLAEADASLTLCESFAFADGGGIIAGVPSIAAPTLALRAAVAELREDGDAADALLQRAVAAAGDAPLIVTSVQYFAAWCAASRAAPAAAARHAAICVEAAARLGGSAFMPLARVISGWSAAMLGDASGLQLAESSFEEANVRFLASALLTMRAEAHAHHGDLLRAGQLIGEARAVAAITGERTLNARLRALAEELSPLQA